MVSLANFCIDTGATIFLFITFVHRFQRKQGPNLRLDLRLDLGLHLGLDLGLDLGLHLGL